MATELSRTYRPAEVEPAIAARWERARSFRADPAGGGRPYCIVIPPPNVTAALHMGHALNNTLQDILIRWRRMCGDSTLWMPGTDHAGIATQTVVEKRILAEEGKRRTEFERDVFVARIQAWKDDYEAQITKQLQAMGCSCDWERQRFTMDPVCARAVREAFFRFFRDGLIYRGKRLVNWDPATQTALADDEVEMHEIDGHFWYLRYPLVEPAGDLRFVTVATTRPETMLGDTAVAIHPADPRADRLRGRMVRLPIVNRIVPIVADDYVVLPDPDSADEKARFSTGFLKVTPAHDPNDYEIGRRFDLPMINVLAPDGTISNRHGWPADDWERADHEVVPLGMDRDEAREAIVDWFRANDLLESVRPYRHAVGHSYRSHVPIEPYLSDQWYLKVTDPRLAGAALAAMEPQQRSTPTEPRSTADRAGRLRFTPPRYARTFETWHENIRDWCISRQLWWGHRIPVWSQDLPLPHDVEPAHTDRGPDARTCAALDRAAGGHFADTFRARFPEVRYILSCPSEAPGPDLVRTHICLDRDDPACIAWLEERGWQRDPDVLDTWFSSALWPFSTMGWPEETPELARWNPGNVLCTAREIITLWVSRMVMTNLYLLDRLPFTDVFIHAMIQDGEGRKMSKSLGNGVDPLDIIHSHGADAMRFTLASMTTSTQDVRMPVERDPETKRNTSPKFDLGRNFANKMWNALRFALGTVEEKHEGAEARRHEGAERQGRGLADRWVLSRLAATVRATDQALANFEFSQYAQQLYDFFWRDLCDWYIEAVKPTVRGDPEQRRVLAACLDVALRLLHPVMPFITERLWQRLNEVAPQRGVDGLVLAPGDLLVRAAWPVVSDDLIDEQAESDFRFQQAWVGAIREIRTSHQIPPRETLQFAARVPEAVAARLAGLADGIEALAGARPTALAEALPDELDDLVLVGTSQVLSHEVRVYRTGDAGVDHAAERQRLERRLAEARGSLGTLQGRLNNRGYVDKAPPHLVEQTRQQLATAEKEVAALEAQLAGLS